MERPRLCLPFPYRYTDWAFKHAPLEGFDGMTTWKMGPLQPTLIVQDPASACTRALLANSNPDLLVSFVQRHLRFSSATLHTSLKLSA